MLHTGPWQRVEIVANCRLFQAVSELMKLSDFSYGLPEELIAFHPTPGRSDSRLMCVNRDDGSIAHRRFTDLPDLLKPQDLLVFNNTRVLPARLYGRKSTGGRIEALIERIHDPRTALVQLRASKSPAVGTELYFDPLEATDAELPARVIDRQDAFYLLEFDGREGLPALLDGYGHMPLPPYIRREDAESDRERYQTVFGDRAGAVAAPTAGLHFDHALLRRLSERGIESVFVTLHVGSGTFQPVRVEDVEEHRMHSEWLDVPQETCDRILACKARGGRVVAVGTTSVRSLESAAMVAERRSGGSLIQPLQGDTDIFIYPGYRFRVVDAMITNFHLPESTLIMLVSAFAGRETVLEAYREAVRQRYRFFSYGDAMFIG